MYQELIKPVIKKFEYSKLTLTLHEYMPMYHIHLSRVTIEFISSFKDKEWLEDECITLKLDWNKSIVLNRSLKTYKEKPSTDKFHWIFRRLCQGAIHSARSNLKEECLYELACSRRNWSMKGINWCATAVPLIQFLFKSKHQNIVTEYSGI